MKDISMKINLFRRQSPVVKMIALSMFAGLLIWAKLRLVTDFPRTVQADPVDRQVDSKQAIPDQVDQASREPEETTSSRDESSAHDPID
jgi:hypothetical protein